MRDDVRRARAMARGLIFAGAALTVLTFSVAVAKPGFMGVRPQLMGFPVDALAMVVGMGCALVGLGWMIRIYRSHLEADRANWRSRDRSPVPVPGWSRNGHKPTSGDNRATRIITGSMREDVRRARTLAQMMLVLAVAMAFLALFLWIAAPGGPSPMSYEPPWHQPALPMAGAAMYLIGLTWMIRIYRRSHLEPDASYWRYRSQGRFLP